MTTENRGEAFHCHECGSQQITVTRVRQMLMVDGKRRLHSACDCRGCGNKIWSRHKTALRMSRVADAAASGGGEDGG